MQMSGRKHIKQFDAMSNMVGGILLFAVLEMVLMFVSSCSNTKFLTEKEHLYTYTWLGEKGIGKVKNKPLKAYELYSTARVKTNRPLIMMPRTNLAIYNYMKPKKKWGLHKYMFRVFGKPPVLLKTVNPDFRLKVMEQQLFDFGHFDSEIKLDLKYYGKNDKKVRAKYKIFFKPAYTINEYDFLPEENDVDRIIESSMSETLIKTGDEYWVKTLKQERYRLGRVLSDKGYYFFRPDYLLFDADTTIGKKQLNLSLFLKDDIPLKAYKKYSVRDVNVSLIPRPDILEGDNTVDSIMVNGCHYFAIGNVFRPEIITKAISIKPNSVYSFKTHENTLKYLQEMGAFKSVIIDFVEVDTSQLDANIVLEQLDPVQTNLNLNFAVSSDDFMGPQAIAAISHSNVFGGAERLSLQISGGFEWQKYSKRKEYDLGFNSYDFGTQVNLTFPRFLLPFEVRGQSKKYVPQTFTGIGFRRLKRVRYYSMNLSLVNFGYSWRTSPKREYKVQPLAVNYLRLTESSQEFDDFLEKYPQVALSFEEQFIIGSVYNYTYLTKLKRRPFDQFYYKAELDLAGNLLGAVYSLSGKSNSPGEGPDEIMGAPYSQYFKITNDVRYSLFFTKKSQIASRIIAGIGVPYANSEVLPYVKQYFVGGSQDIRAFYARSIGPGSFQPSDSIQRTTFIDQSGEIKLEVNVEFRFPITYKTSGALFVDAGNVWLINEDTSRPGGKFGFDSFARQIAIGSGLGLRVDIDYFVLRLDVGVPLRKPYKEKNNYWIFSNPQYFSDFVISFAVGLPF